MSHESGARPPSPSAGEGHDHGNRVSGREFSPDESIASASGPPIASATAGSDLGYGLTLDRSSSPPDASRVELGSGQQHYQLGDRLQAAINGGTGTAASNSAAPSPVRSRAGSLSGNGGDESGAGGSGSSSSGVGVLSRFARRRSSSGGMAGSPLSRRILAGLGPDSNLARAQAHHPLLAAATASSGAGAAASAVSPSNREGFVALDMEGDGSGRMNRWRYAMPEDVFVHFFSFLTPAELAQVSCVNRSWSHAAYEPSLWVRIDLSNLSSKVDDAFVVHLLGSNRFVHLRQLSLEGCQAVTDKSVRAIIHFCPNLRELRLTGCEHIQNPWIFPDLVRAMPYLRRLELFGVTHEYGIVNPMLDARPKLDLGLFWMEYCAENGVRMDGRGLATCRYEEGGEVPHAAAAGGAGGRGCWGRIRGRIIYSNTSYPRSGNYPHSILYSCENHSQIDFSQPDFARCHVCERLFHADVAKVGPLGGRRSSMWTELICKVCFDMENLSHKQSWIALESSSSIREFSTAHLLSQTLHVAQRKNLPTSLRSFGVTELRLDYNVPEPLPEEQAEAEAAANNSEEDEMDDDERHLFALLSEQQRAQQRQQHRVEREEAIQRARRIDVGAVPMSAFVAVNGWRMDEAVHSVRNQLKEAKKNLNTRALLVYDGNDNIEVLADKRVILEGREGEEHLQLTVQAWHQALEIMYPILIIMILVLYFTMLFMRETVQYYDGTTNYMAYISHPSGEGMSVLIVLLIALAAFVLLLVFVCLIYRYREQCERCFKRFLVADILLIFMFGVATISWLLALDWRAYVDGVSFAVWIWNLSMTGLVTLYYPMPERLHQAFLILLNAIMSIMLVATLGRWLVLTFLLIAALGDILSEIRPQMRLLSPFIIPANVELLYNTPKILYTVGGLRLRAADLMWYGLLTGLAMGNTHGSRVSDLLLGGSFIVVSVMSSLAIMLFVAPFLGKRIRPLPVAVLIGFALTMMQEDVFMPFVVKSNYINKEPLEF